MGKTGSDAVIVRSKSSKATRRGRTFTVYLPFVTAPIEFANYRINSIRTNFELDRIVFLDS
jgi:hypothetical protein